MIAVNLTRTEIELLIKSVEVAGLSGWPSSDDRVRVQVLRQQLEKKIGELRAEGWQGGR
jgi:hypothetical protein